MLRSKEEVVQLACLYAGATAPTKPRYHIQLLDSIRFPLTIDGETRLCYRVPHGYTNCPKEAEKAWLSLRPGASNDSPSDM